MFARTVVTALLVLPLMATTLASREAQACSPLTGFSIHQTFPEVDATDVPIDGVVVLVGEGWDSDAATVEVRLGDVVVAGELTMITTDRYVWRSSAPLEPNTAYTAHITSSPVYDTDLPGEFDLEFTTGSETAPKLMDAVLASSSVEGFEREIKECVVEGDLGSCSACDEWKVVAVEDRMRVVAEIAAPGGPFAGFHGGRLHFGPDADTQEFDAMEFEPAEGGAVVHVIDLGIAGTWPSEQVCVRPEVEDPRGVLVQGEVSCLDIGEVNQPPVEPLTTGDGESEGGSDSSGGSDDTGLDTAHWDDREDKGCGCRGDVGAAGNAGGFGLGMLTMLTILIMLLGSPGRRRRA